MQNFHCGKAREVAAVDAPTLRRSRKDVAKKLVESYVIKCYRDVMLFLRWSNQSGRL